MQWSELLADADPDLAAAGASDAAIRAIERSLGCTFPPDYRAFLQHADGGTLDDGRVVFFAVAPGEHPDDTLRAANLSQPAEAPLVIVGYERDEEFGFRKSDLPSPRAGVYVVSDDGELAFAAPSFTDFVQDLSRRIANDRKSRARPWWQRWFGGG
jgi:hypothetical protein